MPSICRLVQFSGFDSSCSMVNTPPSACRIACCASAAAPRTANPVSVVVATTSRMSSRLMVLPRLRHIYRNANVMLRMP